MSELGAAVGELLGEARSVGRRRVVILYRGDFEAASRIIGLGHNTVVVSDRFRSLYRLFKKLDLEHKDRVTVLECRFGALPLGEKVFDAVVLTCGLPRMGAQTDVLRQMGRLLRPGGLFAWPHPVEDGWHGSLGKALVPWRPRTAAPRKRHELCASLMASGFLEVGQQRIVAKVAPWVLTHGRKAPRPWEDDVGRREESTFI